jgi:putative addiction module killer protein
VFSVKRTPEFDTWLDGLRDSLTRKRLQLRLRKAALGNLGDVKAVGEGVFEMREFFGAGWRMYYVQHGQVVVVMLGGGDKSSQNRDIEAAKQLATSLVFEE